VNVGYWGGGQRGREGRSGKGRERKDDRKKAGKALPLLLCIVTLHFLLCHANDIMASELHRQGKLFWCLLS